MGKKLNRDYAIVQGTYWMYFGVIGSFAAVFLLDKGYTNGEIGIILALASVFSILIQPWVSDYTDRSKKRSFIGIIQLITLMLLFLGMGLWLFPHKAWGLSLLFILLLGGHTVMQPLINGLNFHLTEGPVVINFGVARSVGSLAYAGLCAVLGILVHQWGQGVIPFAAQIILVSLLLVLFFLKKHALKNRWENRGIKTKTMEEKTEEIRLLPFLRRHKIFILINVGVVGLFFSNGVLNNFMIQIVENVGGNSRDMGWILSIMAVLEIPTMVFYKNIRRKFANPLLLKVSSIAFFIKIGLCYWADSVAMLYVAQLMQLVAFALFLPAMVHFIDEIMEKGEAVKGQALYVMMTTVGGVFASFFGGIILDDLGVKSLLLIATLATLAGATVVWFSIGRISTE